MRSLLKPGELQSNQLILVATFQYRVVGARMGTVDSELIAKLQQTFQVRGFTAVSNTACKTCLLPLARERLKFLWHD